MCNFNDQYRVENEYEDPVEKKKKFDDYDTNKDGKISLDGIYRIFFALTKI